MADISKIDKNFSVSTGFNVDDLVFYNVSDNLFCLYGVEYNGRSYERMPYDVAKTVNDSVVQLYTNTSGGRIRFETDSPYVAVSVKMPCKECVPHITYTGTTGLDVYADGLYCKSFIPPVGFDDGYKSICHFEDGRKRQITINLPLYNNVESIHIGLKSGAEFNAADKYKYSQKVVFYGSSITQGACASRPGLAYASILSNSLDFDYINLGFSAGAMGEVVMAEYIASLKPDVFVMDYDHNAPTPEFLDETHEKFFKCFRKLCPETPVIIMSAPNLPLVMNVWKEWINRRDIVKKTYDNAIASGDKNVYFVDGEYVLNEDWNMCSSDLIHPNDIGHMNIAKSLTPMLKKVLDKNM